MAELVADFESSGLTRRDFSQRAGIAVGTLDYYRRRVRERRGVRILPVRIAREASQESGRGFQLSLPNGVRIDSGWDFPAQDLARLLRVAVER